ncbi:M15 family metallopeptidase [Moorena producens]|uniref:M15 family metallopeptidase n=1 Tax=Moorena producens TaxID=1155739 RepID=UPI003C739B7E
MKTETIHRQIKSFKKRFGEAHLLLACHAALPLAITPDLLYCIWTNFQQDVKGRGIDIPWVAVTDLLFSGLWEEVGLEIYEMDATIREMLLNYLKDNHNFGEQRIKELSEFLLVYIQPQLESDDPDIQEFAKAQRWTAQAYLRPKSSAKRLGLALSRAYQHDRDDLIRIAAVVETLSEPLSKFKKLLIYGRGMTRFARGDLEGAKAEFDKIRRWGNHAHVAGVRLLLPKNQELTREKPKSFRVYWVTSGIVILVLVGGVNWVQSPPPDSTSIKVKDMPGCSTSAVRGLDQQLINRLNVVAPNSLVSFADLNVDMGPAVWPYLQLPAKQALQQAIDERGRSLSVNSAYRTIAQQLVLWNLGRDKRCGIRGAARPPESNHQSGLALDIPDYQDWRPFLEKHGWQWDGPKDRPHFDYVGANTIDIRANSVLAFQQLWNLNNPTDRIEENGSYDAETELRLNNSPIDGFPKES